MSWAKKFPPGSPRNDFRDSGQGAVTPRRWLLKEREPENLKEGGRTEYQSEPDRIVKSTRGWITFSPLEWITFTALQTPVCVFGRPWAHRL